MRVVVFAVIAWYSVAMGCYQCGNTAYYGALEKLGVEKRDLLVKRVSHAREAQEDAKIQFRDTLEEFQSLVGYSGGDLEARYEKIRSEYDASVAKAGEVRDRINGIRKVSESLFAEWERELERYANGEMRRESAAQLAETRRRSADVIRAMERAASRMDPVLERFEDQVLFLKHNLNARALGSLQGTADRLATEVDALIRDMEASIAEADRFVKDVG